MSLTKLSKESDIPAGDGKIANIFYSVSQGDKEGFGCDSIFMYCSVQFFSMKLFQIYLLSVYIKINKLIFFLQHHWAEENVTYFKQV